MFANRTRDGDLYRQKKTVRRLLTRRRRVAAAACRRCAGARRQFLAPNRSKPEKTMLFVTTAIFASAASGATHTATSLFTLKKCLRAQKRIGERDAFGAQSAQKLAERSTLIIVGGDRDKANDRIGARRQFRLQTLSDIDAAIV